MNDAQIRESILDEAKGYVLKDRNSTYGTPEDNFRRIAKLWDAYAEIRPPGPETPTDVAIKMMLMKIARLAYNPKHRDSWVDIAGYAACGAGINLADNSSKNESAPDPNLPQISFKELERHLNNKPAATKPEPGVGCSSEKTRRLMADPDENNAPSEKLTNP